MSNGYDIDTVPCPRDANGWIMADRGTEPYCDRQTFGTSYRDIKFPVDCKEIAFRVVSGTFLTRGNSAGSVAYFDAGAAVNDGGGLVTLPAALHGFVATDSVVITGPTNYAGTFTLEAGTDANNIQITATYVAETLAVTDYMVGHRPVTWEATDGFVWPLAKEAFTALFQGKASAGTAVVDFLYWR